MQSQRLPDDIIYYMIFPFLVNYNICNTSEFQIFCVNKRMYSAKPSCFSEPKIKFENQFWCLIHTPHEYGFSKYMRKAQLTQRPSRFDLDNVITYHNYDNTYTSNDLLYYWRRVLNYSSYKVDHLCCGGQGVVLSPRINLEV